MASANKNIKNKQKPQPSKKVSRIEGIFYFFIFLNERSVRNYFEFFELTILRFGTFSGVFTSYFEEFNCLIFNSDLYFIRISLPK